MGILIDKVKSATGSEGIVESMFKIIVGGSSVVSGVNSTRAAHYSKENGKKIDNLDADVKAISTKLGVVRENTDDIKNGQMAAMNKIFGMVEKKKKEKKKDKQAASAPTTVVVTAEPVVPEQPKNENDGDSKKK